MRFTFLYFKSKIKEVPAWLCQMNDRIFDPVLIKPAFYFKDESRNLATNLFCETNEQCKFNTKGLDNSFRINDKNLTYFERRKPKIIVNQFISCLANRFGENSFIFALITFKLTGLVQ